MSIELLKMLLTCSKVTAKLLETQQAYKAAPMSILRNGQWNWSKMANPDGLTSV